MDSNTIIEATLAFVFNADFTKVLLIKKKKPIQHAGRLNGLGGKLEAGESHLECVVREVHEEAGLEIAKDKWNFVGKMTWANWRVTIWTCMCNEAQQSTFPEENVSWQTVHPLPKNVIENLEWLIPLSIDVNQKKLNREKSLPTVDIFYN